MVSSSPDSLRSDQAVERIVSIEPFGHVFPQFSLELRNRMSAARDRLAKEADPSPADREHAIDAIILPVFQSLVFLFQEGRQAEGKSGERFFSIPVADELLTLYRRNPRYILGVFKNYFDQDVSFQNFDEQFRNDLYRRFVREFEHRSL